MNNKKSGFTLAEVLITLGIIGVVAALTIPVLLQKYEEKVTVTKVKKMYSILSNAYELAKIEYGDISQWGVSSEPKKAALDIREKFEKYLKYTKLCDNTNDLKECGVADVIYKNDDKAVDVISPSIKNNFLSVGMLLADGSSLWYHYSGRGVIYYDVNGLKNPNSFGRDIFGFEIHNNKQLQAGNEEDQYKECDLKKNAFSCTKWVVYKGNMDYLQ